MVNGLKKFKEFFHDYTENYVLIGGTACDIIMTDAGLHFRATKDLDIILIVEALNQEFVKKFWGFVKEGGYKDKQKSEKERKYYRFLNPENKDFPSQLELFARKPDLLDLNEKSNLTPIPIENDLSSLSAILMNDDYYNFTLENSSNKNGLRIASTETLICLKAKAYLDMVARKNNGENIDGKNIKKHKNDVIRLAVLLSEINSIALPSAIKNDMKKFIEIIEKETIDSKSIGKNMGFNNLDLQSVFRQIKQSFSL